MRSRRSTSGHGKPNVPVERVPHPSSRDAAALVQAWHGAIERLRQKVTPDPGRARGRTELRLLVPGGRLRRDPERRPAVRRARLPRRRRRRQAGPSAAQQLVSPADPRRRPHADLDRAGQLSEYLGTPVDPLGRPDVRARRPRRDDGRTTTRSSTTASSTCATARSPRCRRRTREPPPEFAGVKVLETQGHDLPGPDRPARPPELQRAPALGRARSCTRTATSGRRATRTASSSPGR